MRPRLPSRATGVLIAAAMALPAAACMGDGDDGGAGPTAADAPAGSGAATAAPAATASGGDVFAAIPDIVAAVQPSVVAVLAEGPQGSGEGSGVIVDGGTIVTNNHVVDGATDVEVALANGERVAATVQATDPLTDLAVLETDRDDLPAAEFAPGLPRVGELAIALGNPLGFENTATAGIVSGLHRAVPSGGQTPALVDLLQTDAAISPGNSGGALVGADGRVLGINVAYIPPEARAVSIGFAIPAPTVREVVDELLADGRAEHVYLGIQPGQVTPELAERFGLDSPTGAVVLGVLPGTPAEEAGLEASDIITAIGGEPVETVEDVFAALRGHEPGDQVEVAYLRDGESRTATVTLAERPQE
jgi:S1-C subfamily serine protease